MIQFKAASRLPALIDMAPKLAGCLHGITDTIYSSIGFIIPPISSAIISKVPATKIKSFPTNLGYRLLKLTFDCFFNSGSDPYSIHAWKPLWYMCSAICTTGLIVFTVFVKCEGRVEEI